MNRESHIESLHATRAEVAKGEYGISKGWVMSVDQACTKWLRERGLLASQQSPILAAAQAGCAERRRRLKQ